MEYCILFINFDYDYYWNDFMNQYHINRVRERDFSLTIIYFTTHYIVRTYTNIKAYKKQSLYSYR